MQKTISAKSVLVRNLVLLFLALIYIPESKYQVSAIKFLRQDSFQRNIYGVILTLQSRQLYYDIQAVLLVTDFKQQFKI